MKVSKNPGYLLIFLLISSTILWDCMGCVGTPTKKDPRLPTGVEVETLGPKYYRFLATARASQSSIDADDSFKMKTTACTAAELLVRHKLLELEPDEPKRLIFLERRSHSILGDGIYCKAEMVYDARPRENVPKPGQETSDKKQSK